MSSPDIAVREACARRTPAPDDVRSALEHMLASPRFPASEKRRAFLRFIVEESLSGRAERLKGFSVAVAVFGRDETFDSQADPVVRLEARRLRRDLDSYYVNEGSQDAVRISIPKGSYIPHFEYQDASHSPRPASVAAPTHETIDAPANADPQTDGGMAQIKRLASRGLMAGALAVMLFAIAIGGWMLLAGKDPSVLHAATREPAVVVLPFESLSAADDSRYLAGGIGHELIGDLMRFPGFRVFTLPVNAAGDAERELTKLGRDLGVAYVVAGSVRTEAQDVHVAIRVLNATTGQVLWTESYDRPLTPKALIGVQRDLAAEIATVLGQPYGIVNSDLNARMATPDVSYMQSYVCVLRAYGYRRSFPRAEFDSILGCLEKAVQRDPDFSDAWAMLSWLRQDAGRIGYTDERGRRESYDKALRAATRAVQLEPNNTRAIKALATVNHYLGRYDESERLARRALELNPNDPEAMAQLGWRLAARGKFSEGIPVLKRAIARSVKPPGWYYHLIAIDLYMKRDYEQMLSVAERSAVDGSGFSQTLIAIAAGALGKSGKARDALKIMSQHAPLARDPAGYMRRHGATDDIITALMAGLKQGDRIASNNAQAP